MTSVLSADKTPHTNSVFSNDVTTAMLVSQNKEMAAMLVSQTKPLGFELYFYANTFFCFSKPTWPVVKWMKTLYKEEVYRYKVTARDVLSTNW